MSQVVVESLLLLNLELPLTHNCEYQKIRANQTNRDVIGIQPVKALTVNPIARQQLKLDYNWHGVSINLTG
jgi:hypothetical protein